MLSNNKKILSSLTVSVIALSLISAGSVLAYSSWTTMGTSGMYMKMKGQENMTSMMSNNAMAWILNPFLRKDLTDSEKTNLKEILNKHKDEMQALHNKLKEEMKLSKTSSGASTISSLETEMKTLHEKFISEITPYLDSVKLEEFKKKMDEKMLDMHSNKGNWKMWMKGNELMKNKKEMNKMNHWNKEMRPSLRKEMSPSPFMNISFSQIDKKLDSLKTTEEKISWINTVTKQLDNLYAKATSSKSKNTITKIKEYLSDKLDEINGVTDSISTELDSILK